MVSKKNGKIEKNQKKKNQKKSTPTVPLPKSDYLVIQYLLVQYLSILAQEFSFLNKELLSECGRKVWTLYLVHFESLPRFHQYANKSIIFFLGYLAAMMAKAPFFITDYGRLAQRGVVNARMIRSDSYFPWELLGSSLLNSEAKFLNEFHIEIFWKEVRHIASICGLDTKAHKNTIGSKNDNKEVEEEGQEEEEEGQEEEEEGENQVIYSKGMNGIWAILPKPFFERIVSQTFLPAGYFEDIAIVLAQIYAFGEKQEAGAWNSKRRRRALQSFRKLKYIEYNEKLISLDSFLCCCLTLALKLCYGLSSWEKSMPEGSGASKNKGSIYQEQYEQHARAVFGNFPPWNLLVKYRAEKCAEAPIYHSANHPTDYISLAKKSEQKLDLLSISNICKTTELQDEYFRKYVNSHVSTTTAAAAASSSSSLLAAQSEDASAQMERQQDEVFGFDDAEGDRDSSENDDDSSGSDEGNVAHRNPFSEIIFSKRHTRNMKFDQILTFLNYTM